MGFDWNPVSFRTQKNAILARTVFSFINTDKSGSCIALSDYENFTSKENSFVSCRTTGQYGGNTMISSCSFVSESLNCCLNTTTINGYGQSEALLNVDSSELHESAYILCSSLAEGYIGINFLNTGLSLEYSWNNMSFCSLNGLALDRVEYFSSSITLSHDNRMNNTVDIMYDTIFGTVDAVYSYQNVVFNKNRGTFSTLHMIETNSRVSTASNWIVIENNIKYFSIRKCTIIDCIFYGNLFKVSTGVISYKPQTHTYSIKAKVIGDRCFIDSTIFTRQDSARLVFPFVFITNGND